MSLFDRYAELLKSQTGSPLVSLGASLAPLDHIEAGLADRARRYVMDGAEPQLLLALPGYPDACHWLGGPIK